MSFTCTVPASVPSLFHSSSPPEVPVAAKKSVPPTFSSCEGDELRIPARRSLTNVVPASVPSLFHSSNSIRGIEGLEIKRPTDVREILGSGTGSAWIDILDADCPSFCAITFPKFRAAGAVVADKIQYVADGSEIG